MKVYISMPITGYDLKERKQFAEKARKSVCELFNFHAEDVITPFDVPGYKPDQSWEWYMARCLDTMTRTIMAIFVEDWEKSPGCRLEHEWAMHYNIKVVYLSNAKIYGIPVR